MQQSMLLSAKKAFEEAGRQEQFPEYMNKKQASKYLNINDRTLNKFITQGLKITVLDGVQRLSKKECDRFMLENQK
ncbi:hypothetical protein FEZ51_07695 [Pediococcus stilesii]|uniref:Helix-turn-helix domain-containing protein n=1 Tax=Pediococcus stilesii TaxID=331679 RepID=A0A5R9BSY5_9LACO|nr:hypothetical protein [Pediococcus stilesii]TLQ03784.1 hypothetical protein FEZ51_07695 [Pediococcus stilesii]